MVDGVNAAKDEVIDEVAADEIPAKDRVDAARVVETPDQANIVSRRDAVDSQEGLNARLARIESQNEKVLFTSIVATRYFWVLNKEASLPLPLSQH